MNDIKIVINTWNERVKECYKRKYNSQEKFAEIIGVEQSNLNRWLNVGQIRDGTEIGFPKFENMIKISEALEEDLSYLIGEMDKSPYIYIKKGCEMLDLDPGIVESFFKSKKIKSFIQSISNLYCTYKKIKYLDIELAKKYHLDELPNELLSKAFELQGDIYFKEHIDYDVYRIVSNYIDEYCDKKDNLVKELEEKRSDSINAFKNLLDDLFDYKN